jgi:hypothetical protein
VENDGDVALEGSALRIGWGRPDDPSRIVEAPDLERLEPGESVEIEVPVTLAPFAWGEYAVAGRIVGFEDSQFETTTSSYPWGLLLLPFVAIAALVARGVVRRRRADEAGADAPDDEPAPAPAPAGPESADA